REGTVRQRLAGRVPRRGDGAWDGWLDLPGLDVPPDGLVVSANHRRERWAAISDEFAPQHRARRLEELLADRAGLTVDEAAAVHADTLLRPARDWQARLAGLVVTGPAAQRRDLLLHWDGRMDAGCTAAGAFADLRTTLVRRLAAHPALVDLHADPGLDPIWTPWVQPEPRIALALDRWVAGESPPGVDLDAEIRAARSSRPPSTRPVRGGESHGVDVPGHGWVPLAGDDACVLSSASVPGVTDACWRGPVARLVWDLDDRSASRWTVPDDVATWAAGSVAGLEDR
ncbi:MAG: penicillin acylase family protein, partial [Aeromicrobium erythreum]